MAVLHNVAQLDAVEMIMPEYGGATQSGSVDGRASEALLAQDKNLYEIAEQLGVSYYTVRNHVQHVLGKMGVHSTLEAVALYLLSQSQDSDL